MTVEPKSIEPRRESEVIPFERLTEEQRAAAAQVHALLREYVKVEAPETSERSGVGRFLPAIDEERRNQNILIDGDRGSGKSALLVTLLDLWNAMFDKNYVARPASRTDPAKERAHAADREAKHKAWQIEGAWPVVPVGLLDLHPLPRHVPVLLYIAESLLRVVEAMEGQSNPKEDPPPWHPGDQPQNASRKAWESLVRAIVSGWDDAAPDRWSKLDAEACFYEVDRATRDRRDVVEQFHTFLDALVKDFKRWRHWTQEQPPLFVLAIDDADMIAERSTELLNAVRLFHHPRLVFLLAGHSGLFYRAVEDDFARGLRSLRGRSRESDRSPVRDEFVQGLAHDFYEKVIPPPHRCRLPEIPPQERHKYVESLMNLSAKCWLPSQKRTVPVANMLRAPMLAAALPDRIRALRDVELLARREPGESDAHVLTRVVLHLWRRAIDRNTVEDYTRQHLKTRVREFLDDLPRDSNLITDLSSSVVVAPLHPSPVVQLEGGWMPASRALQHGEDRVAVQFQGPLSIRGVLKSGVEIPEGILAAFMLAYQIAFDHGLARGTEAAPSASELLPGFVRAHYEHKRQGREYAFVWPLHNGCTWLDIANINFRWNASLRAGGSIIDNSARWFLVCVAQLKRFFSERFPLVIAEVSGGEEAPPWSEVAKRVLWVARRDELETRDIHLREWAIGRALLLSAPESGLPADSALQLIDAFKSEARELWKVMCDRVRVERLKRAREALGISETQRESPDATALLEEIDRQNPSHPWYTEVEGRPQPTNGGVSVNENSGLLSLLTRLGVVTPDEIKLIEPPLDELLRTDSALSEDLVRELRPLEDARGVAPTALVRLWRTLTHRVGYESLRDVITVRNGSLELMQLDVRLDTLQNRFALRGSLRTGSNIEFQYAPFFAIESQKVGLLPDVLQRLYELAWNRWGVTSGGGSDQTPFSSLWGDIIVTQFEGRPFHALWPFPPCKTFAQYRSFRTVWSKALDAGMRLQKTLPDPRQVTLSLVVKYIECGNVFTQGGSSPIDATIDLSANLHVNYPLLTSGNSVSTPWPSWSESLRCWILGQFLLFAPESGIDDQILSTLRSEIFPTKQMPRISPNVLEFLRANYETIRAERINRMRSSSIAAEISLDDAQNIVNQIDRETPDHPWHGFLQEIASEPTISSISRAASDSVPEPPSPSSNKTRKSKRSP